MCLITTLGIPARQFNFFFSSRRRHTRGSRDWSSDVCSSDLADPRAGDGAGILVQIPHTFFKRKAAEIGFQLPKPGDYAVGALFMPKETAWRKVIQSIIADQIRAEQLMLLGWRDVPVDNSSLGETVKPPEPANMQVFIGRGDHIKTEDEFERRLYILRKSISQAIYLRRDRGLAGYYPAS